MIDRKYLILMGLGMEIVALIIAMLYLGSLLDPELGGQGYGPMIGAVLALVVWISHLVIYVQNSERDIDPDENEGAFKSKDNSRSGGH